MNQDSLERDPGTCPRRIDLEDALSEEVEGEQRMRILRHVEACPTCKRLWQDLESERREFLARHPFAKLEEGMERLQRKSERRRMVLLRLIPAGVAAFAIILGAWLAFPGSSGVRTKGSVALSIYLMRGNDIRPAQADEVFAPRDRVQFLVSSGTHRYLLLVSVDESGRVFNYTPGTANFSVPITPGERRPLPESVELDESREDERIFALFSNEPLSFSEIKILVEGALSEMKQHGKTVKDLEKLSGPWPQASVLLRKH
jgi:hypothetical protein